MYYTNYGKQRGGCGHAHRDILSARKCLEAHRRKCVSERATGESGYSDRQMWSIADRDAMVDPASHGTSSMIEQAEWERYY